MNIFQSLYNFFRKLSIPQWLKPFVQELNDLMITILKSAGQAYIGYLKAKIIEAASHKDWDNKTKFDFVFKEAKIGFKRYAVELKDNELNTVINYFVSLLKKDNIIS